MLTRRQLISVAGSAILTSSAKAEKQNLQYAYRTGKPQMHVGTQKGCTSDELQFYKRCGVNHICGTPDSWTSEGLARLNERCSANDIALDMVPIGMPRSVGLLGDKAHRDSQIEKTCDQIRLAAKAAIRVVAQCSSYCKPGDTECQAN